MKETTYSSVLDIAQMFSTDRKLKDFFVFYIENVIRFCDKNEDKFYPFVYKKEKETFSLSFDFFIKSLAKFYDPGNEEIEQNICSDLLLSASIGVTDKDELKRLHKNRSFVIISILQDYYDILFPNNRRIFVTKLKGFLTLKDSYYVPIVYESKEKNPIQYETVPVKKENLLNLDIPLDYINKLISLSDKKGLKDVAFNAAQTQKYWQESNLATVLRYE